MNKLPIYILNLRRQAYKYDIIDGLLKEQGITHHQRFEGVEGKLLTQKEIDDISSFWMRKFGKKSVIGCALSYLKLWEHIVDTEDGYVLTMEDSFVPSKDFHKNMELLLEEVMNNREKYDYINLYNEQTKDLSDKEEIDFGLVLLKHCNLSIKCCLIHVSCLRRLLSEIKEINEPIDAQICTIINKNKMNVFIVKDNYFGEANFNNSTISGKSPFLLHKIGSKIKTRGHHDLSREILYGVSQINGYDMSAYIHYAFIFGIICGFLIKLEWFLWFLILVFLFDFLNFRINKKNVFNSLMNVSIIYGGYYLGLRIKNFWSLHYR